jgi:hypothetical protein
MVEIFWLFFVMFETESSFAVFGKTRALLENSDTPIERYYKNKSNTFGSLVQKIQLDEHGKFRYYVMFATMDMPKYAPYDIKC